MQRNERASAYTWLMKGAEKGIDWAMFEIGRLYHGDGDYGNALCWFERAAEKDYGDAENWIGLMYYNANGRRKSVPDAKYWFQRSANHGNSVGAQNLRLPDIIAHGQQTINLGF